MTDVTVCRCSTGRTDTVLPSATAATCSTWVATGMRGMHTWATLGATACEDREPAASWDACVTTQLPAFVFSLSETAQSGFGCVVKICGALELGGRADIHALQVTQCGR